MATTKAAVRRRAVFEAKANGRSRGFSTRDGVNALAATGGAATTLISTSALPTSGIPTTWKKGHWLWLPAMAAAYQRRKIASFLGSAQQFTHEGPDYDATTITALANGTPFLITEDDPDLWDSAQNEAMQTLLSTIKFDEFTPTGAYRYTVSATPISLSGIIRASQILDIETHDSGDAAGEEAWRPWANGYNTWDVYPDETGVIIDFGSRAPQSTDTIRIKWASQYAVPASESASIAIDEYAAALATVAVMSDWLADANNPDDDWNLIRRRIDTQYETQKRLALGTDSGRSVGRTKQRTGIAGVRGRMGGRR